jgi:Na+-driven multidrug efflux pump
MEKNLKNRKEINMIEGSIVKNMLLFALPIIFTGVLQNLYNTADTIVVGRFGGTAALSAVGASTTTTSVVVNVVLGIFVGMNIILARQLGAMDHDGARRTCRTGYVTSLILGVSLTLVG